MKRDISKSADIRLLVALFYERAMSDDLLGPIFSPLKAPEVDREALYQYWTATITGEPTTNTQPFPRHISKMFTRQHFFRWSTLFLQTIDDLYAGPNAENAKTMVIRKSEQFKATLDFMPF